MSVLLKIIGIAIVTVTAVNLIKPYKPEYSFIITIIGAALCFLEVIACLESYFSVLKGIFSDSGLSSEYFSVALKAVGIGYITEFAADTAKDNGQTAVAQKIILGGKAAVFILALPLIKNLLDLALKLVD